MTYNIWIQSEMLFLTKGGKERPVELPHTSLCLGKQLGSWEREIQCSSAVSDVK